MRRSNGGEENRAQVLCMFFLFLFLVYTSANFIAIVFVSMCVCMRVCVYIRLVFLQHFAILINVQKKKKSLTISSFARDRRRKSIKE